MNTNEATARIRTELKRLCPTLSVRHGTGTAYCWVHIRGSGEGHGFNPTEFSALAAVGLSPGRNYCVISPDETDRWVERLETRAWDQPVHVG